MRDHEEPTAGVDPEPHEVWAALTAAVRGDPTLEEQVEERCGDFEARGALRSGQSAIAALRVATRAGLRWDVASRRFKPTLRRRLRPFAALAIVIVGVAVAAMSYLASTRDLEQASAITAAATAIAAFGALVPLVLRR